MKKKLKITLGVIGGIIFLIIIDLICIFTINQPLFAIKKDNGSMYQGIFYDTYNCAEFSVLQIKAKGTKFSCTNVSINKDKESTFKTTKVKNVSIEISDISLTGATVTIKDTNETPYTYGEWYKIEKEENGMKLKQ